MFAETGLRPKPRNELKNICSYRICFVQLSCKSKQNTMDDYSLVYEQLTINEDWKVANGNTEESSQGHTSETNSTPKPVELNGEARKVHSALRYLRLSRETNDPRASLLVDFTALSSRCSNYLSHNASFPLRNNHAGRYRCTRIKLSNNKPCNINFSRQYELTRHKSTVHNDNQENFICPLCPGRRTFTRKDSLPRHLRQVHSQGEDVARSRRRLG